MEIDRFDNRVLLGVVIVVLVVIGGIVLLTGGPSPDEPEDTTITRDEVDITIDRDEDGNETGLVTVSYTASEGPPLRAELGAGGTTGIYPNESRTFDIERETVVFLRDDSGEQLYSVGYNPEKLRNGTRDIVVYRNDNQVDT